MTRDEVVGEAKNLKFSHIRISGGAIPIDDWRPGRSSAYDGFRIVGGEIVVDQPLEQFGGAWPLLTRGK